MLELPEVLTVSNQINERVEGKHVAYAAAFITVPDARYCSFLNDGEQDHNS